MSRSSGHSGLNPKESNALGPSHLEIGVISRPHGVRGELKVRLHFEESTALEEVERVLLQGPRGAPVEFEIESVRGSSKGLILALAGVAGRSAAESLRGHRVWVKRSAVAPLEEGEYYLVDLVGCEVSLAGKPFARVVQVRPDPSVDTLVIELAGGKRAEVPLVDAWVGKVDIAVRSIELLSSDGVIEE